MATLFGNERVIAGGATWRRSVEQPIDEHTFDMAAGTPGAVTMKLKSVASEEGSKGDVAPWHVRVRAD